MCVGWASAAVRGIAKLAKANKHLQATYDDSNFEEMKRIRAFEKEFTTANRIVSCGTGQEMLPMIE